MATKPQTQIGAGGLGPARSSFDTLYREQAGYLLHTLRRLGVDHRDLDDVAHDTFLVVWRKLPDYDEMRPIRPWLFGIAYRCVLDHQRSARRQRDRLETAAEPVDDRPSALAQIEETEQQRLVLEALDTLRIEQRAIVVMHDIDGTAVPEIATAMEIPLNTAYSRLRLAREQFASAIRELKRAER